MTENTNTRPVETTAQLDVFAAARWLGELWNSSATAVSADRIEWQCNTWGSGRGFGDWIDTALFLVVSEVFGLSTGKNYDGRDELVVSVPMSEFPRIAQLISRLDRMEPEAWPWLDEEVEDPVSVAAEFFELSRAEVADDAGLLDALRIE